MLTLDKQLVEEMIAHAQEEAPNECCGVIAGKGGKGVKLFRAKNGEASPYRYNMDSQDLFRIYRECEENGWEFLAIYHSHTFSEAYPSQTDVRLAFWPESHYVLVSLKDAENPAVRAYRIVDGRVDEVDLGVV